MLADAFAYFLPLIFKGYGYSVRVLRSPQLTLVDCALADPQRPALRRRAHLGRHHLGAQRPHQAPWRLHLPQRPDGAHWMSRTVADWPGSRRNGARLDRRAMLIDRSASDTAPTTTAASPRCVLILLLAHLTGGAGLLCADGRPGERCVRHSLCPPSSYSQHDRVLVEQQREDRQPARRQQRNRRRRWRVRLRPLRSR